MTNTYKSNEIFEALYGENGTEGVKEEDVKNFYIENNARVKYIGLDLHDSEGNDLDEAGKKEITDMADDFLKRAKNADSTDKMLEEFDLMQEEYDKYVADKAAEAAGEETTTEAATEAVTETTSAETVSETSTSDNENTSENEADVTTAENEGASSSETTTITTVVSEAGSEESETTTANPYANETIISVVTTDENTKEEEIQYTPSKTFYDWVYNDAKTNIPEIIEDEDTLYVAVRLDITERMTDEDLWSETSANSTRFNMFSDDLQDKLNEWVAGYSIEKNEKAYKRYDPFDFKTAS